MRKTKIGGMAMPDTREEIARRRAERQKKIRKRRLMVSLMFLLIMAIAIGAVLCVTVLFPITTVTASGSLKYSNTQIIKASGVNADDNFFTLTQKEVIQQLQKTLPYIDSVVIKRSFPDTVHLEVTDAEEYACYNANGAFYVVSEKGIVLSEYDSVPENTFEIIYNGAECVPGKYVKFEDEKIKELSDTLVNNLELQNVRLQSIDLTDKYNIKVYVEGRFEVLLGNESDLDKKIAHLSKMISTISPERSGKINLSMWTSEKSEGSFTENKEE